MRRVAIAGVGITPRTRAYLSQADRKSYKEYVADAAYGAIADVKKGLHPRDIQYVVVNYHGEATVEAVFIPSASPSCAQIAPVRA